MIMRMSLKYKFIFTFIAVVVIAAIAFGTISTLRWTNQLRALNSHQAMQMMQHAVDEALETQLYPGSHDTVQLTENLLGDDVLYAQVVINGSLFSEAYRDSEEAHEIIDVSSLSAPLIRDIPDQARFEIVYPLQVAWEELDESSHHIIPASQQEHQDRPDGYVLIGFSLAKLNLEVGRETLLLTGVSLVLVLLGITVGWFLYRMILGPVEELSTAVRDFGAGNSLSRATVHSGDEIESLANEFNSMANSIVYQRDVLRHKNEELERMYRAQNVFLATMSHELLTPLHSILGYTSLLRDEVEVKLDETGHKYAGAIERAGKHLLSLIENALRFSKLEAGADALHISEVSPAQVIREVVESQRPFADAKGLTIEMDTRSDWKIQTDLVKLKQVLINLLTNAIKFTPKGRVIVSTERKEENTYFEVCDTGIGIDRRDMHRLFEPFTRLAEIDAPSDGMGIGLAVAKRNVELMGGKISVESTPGKGSRFRFFIPKEVPIEAAHS